MTDITQEQIAALKECVEITDEIYDSNLAIKARPAADMLEQLSKERQALKSIVVSQMSDPPQTPPVTVSSTEQDLGALVEHFKAKAERAYVDGVRDAEKALEAAIRRGVFIDKLPDHIHALLTEKDDV